MKRSRQRGFSLLEVAIAMSILVLSLAALIGHEGIAIQMSDYSNKLSQATFLAQGKLLDLEYRLIKDGMDQIDNCEDGDFRDEGFRTFTWKACGYKLEIAEGAAEQMTEQFMQMITGFLGTSGGGAGAALGAAQAQGGPDSAAIAGMISMAVGAIPTFLQQLEDKIRKVRLEVAWKDAVGDRTLILERFVTLLGEDRSSDQAVEADPAALQNPALANPLTDEP